MKKKTSTCLSLDACLRKDTLFEENTNTKLAHSVKIIKNTYI